MMCYLTLIIIDELAFKGVYLVFSCKLRAFIICLALRILLRVCLSYYFFYGTRVH